MSGFGRIVLLGGIVATVAGIAGLRAQTQLADPKDAPKIFASTCSACHKSPQGLAKSGQVAGFLRQHYTTGPEMSAAMAAYLVAAGSGPAAKKDREKAAAAGSDPAAKGKKKQEQAAAQPGVDAKDQRTLRGKQLREAKSQDDRAAAHPAPAIAAPAHPSPASATDAAARQAAPAAAVAETRVAPPPAAEATPPVPTIDIPLPEMPTGPPADLTQSVFASSPVP